ncbi:hypothetical protein POPTR_013G116750v4 [Populus trichocarpa]|uniref:Uncharacterized protein n=1 Tax=Populus trichocarpa TaxID=3694 RepID=A0ACC0S2I5_POPTR|nr:hypothetical protein POPTR_013G116750v4 [Populus trichocarpa]
MCSYKLHSCFKGIKQSVTITLMMRKTISFVVGVLLVHAFVSEGLIHKETGRDLSRRICAARTRLQF